ncbi:hypothetical protein [Bifidobacterium miconisargentati]|uniref:hypothetical protein n=1 Tax=Bifidobacterium miconisargentati TaxID=2834437 RepID=UPI001BDCEC6B|nr:hypothetical protein [Bifidobacterium miconisargentati]MBW3089975.1 hypothetical protein [Bifidobacterium miconisargentati]
MRIIEQYCQGKRSDQSLNEDGLIVTGDFAAVVDGVTSKSIRHLWRPSGGVVAKNLALEAIAELPADADMRQVQSAIDAKFQATYRSRADTRTHGSPNPSDDADTKATYGHADDSPAACDYAVFEREPVERLQANVVVYSARHHEAWLYGDCQIMVNGVQTPTVKRVDELLGELRTFVTLALRERNVRNYAPSDVASGTPASSSPDFAPDSLSDSSSGSSDPARDMILPFLRLQSQFANQRGPYGYFVFDGFTDPTYPIRAIPVHPGDEVVLASDGYPLLRPTLAESEAELRRLRHDDPALINEYRSTKGFTPGLDSFDDRTYLRFVA